MPLAKRMPSASTRTAPSGSSRNTKPSSVPSPESPAEASQVEWLHQILPPESTRG